MPSYHNFKDLLESGTVKSGSDGPQKCFNANEGYALAFGTSTPSAEAGYAPGCVFVNTSSGAVVYNTGTKTSCTFSSIVAAGGTLDAAFDLGKIIDGATSAGNAFQVGDANKVRIYGDATDLYLTTSSGDLKIAPAGGDVIVTGTISASGTITSTGNLIVGANKVVVTAATGAIFSAAGFTSTATTGNAIVINTNMFLVAADTGNTTIAGDLAVTGAATFGSFTTSAIAPASGNLTINAAAAGIVYIGNTSTGGIVIGDNMTISQPALFSTTTQLNFHDTGLKVYASADGQLDIEGDVEIEITAPTLDLDGATAVNIDGAAVSIDGTASSNVSVTGAQLQLATLTSGELDLTSAGLIDINAAANLDIDVTGNTTLDSTGTVSIDGVGNSNVTIDSGDLVLSTTTSGELDLTGAGLVDINAGANLDIDVTGTVDILASTTFSIDGTGASNVSATSGNLTVSTLTTGTLILDSVALIDMNAGANLDIDVTGTVDILASTTFSIDGTGASNVSATSGNLTVSTITSGTLILLSAGIVDIDASGTANVTINTADEATANATACGSIVLTAGAKGAGTGDGGSIQLTPGDTTGGAAGSVFIAANGAGHDLAWYGATAGDSVLFDASGNNVLFTDIDLFLDDDANLLIGATAGAPDATIHSDGTSLYVTCAATADIYLAPKANGAAGKVVIGDLTVAGESELHIKGDDDGDHDPGFIVLYDHNGADYFLWVDSTGDLRINGTKPADELADGTIVGTQA